MDAIFGGTCEPYYWSLFVVSFWCWWDFWLIFFMKEIISLNTIRPGVTCLSNSQIELVFIYFYYTLINHFIALYLFLSFIFNLSSIHNNSNLSIKYTLYYIYNIFHYKYIFAICLYIEYIIFLNSINIHFWNISDLKL